MMSFAKHLPSDNDGPPPGFYPRPNPRRYQLTKKLRPSPFDVSNGSRKSSAVRPGRVGPIAGAGVLHVRFQDSPSWFHPQGVWRKRRAIESKGIPELKGRRFITLTVDPEKFGYCPVKAYEAGKDRLRRFLEAGRTSGLWERGAWWCWKLEFQKNGLAHWHLMIDRTKRFSHYEMERLSEIWGLGRTNCRRIATGNFGYHFKYVFKGVYQESDDGEMETHAVPQWFREYQTTRRVTVKWKDLDGQSHMSVEDKPSTFARVRFWQTSRNFYTGPREQTPNPQEPKSSYVPRTVARVIHGQNNSVVIVARKFSGKYIKSKRFTLTVDRKEFIRHHLWAVDNGHACSLAYGSFVTDARVLNQTTNQSDKCHLSQLHQQNRMTLRQARRLRQQRKSLLLC